MTGTRTCTCMYPYPHTQQVAPTCGEHYLMVANKGGSYRTGNGWRRGKEVSTDAPRLETSECIRKVTTCVLMTTDHLHHVILQLYYGRWEMGLISYYFLTHMQVGLPSQLQLSKCVSWAEHSTSKLACIPFFKSLRLSYVIVVHPVPVHRVYQPTQACDTPFMTDLSSGSNVDCWTPRVYRVYNRVRVTQVT
jgi:hypothetical protein